MLEVIDLACERGGRKLFEALSFNVDRGTLVRIAGANGIGKTSLLRILCGLLQPLSGAVKWQGSPISSQREEYWRNLAYVGHLNAVKDDLTVAETLRAALAIAGRPSSEATIAHALDIVGLGGQAGAMARTLSQGQRRRVALARLPSSTSAPLWILDEPFAALDTKGVDRLSGLISEHLAGGASVIMTTHQEVEINATTAHRIDLDEHALESLAC
jgi:heme exporter protein A